MQVSWLKHKYRTQDFEDMRKVTPKRIRGRLLIKIEGRKYQSVELELPTESNDFLSGLPTVEMVFGESFD